MEPKKNPPNQIQVDLPEDIANGIYTNLAIITHSDSEFLIDFLSALPGVPKAKVKSRVIMTPLNAKRLLRALKDNISKFEQSHGEIIDGSGSEGFPMNLGPTGMA
ncbi:MAG TPA: DUF3467 domain-containing protein [Bacteroidales bacterium]|jgi:hypothetical protein|nr:DUF3467 domain-containing protein [Bacteroidales bacterium]HQN98296.1 DUF3467 domain-containing protein [Bacteroidales bacterium]HQQ03125.1 DUF3467 domain-containing protein [Bacteroidales bacterium]